MDIPREGYRVRRSQRIARLSLLLILGSFLVALLLRIGLSADNAGRTLSGVVLQHEYSEASFVTLIRDLADSTVYVDNSAQCYAAQVGDTVAGVTTITTMPYGADWEC